MLWADYLIESMGSKWRPVGSEEWKTELMDKGLYKPGDVFIVDKDGWLIKVDKLTEMVVTTTTKGTA